MPIKLANVLSTPKSSSVAQTPKTSTVAQTPKTSSVAQTPNTSSVAQTPKKPESLTTVQVSEQPSAPGPFDNVNVKTPKMEDSQFDMNMIRVSFFCCFLAYLSQLITAELVKTEFFYYYSFVIKVLVETTIFL